MNARMLGLFSGFPARQFTDDIAVRLKEELPVRDSLVFVSAWPSDCARNDDDAAGMHGMFASRDMAFQRFHVIDNRTETADAKRLIREASCIFLMGGNATQQFQLICGKGIAEDIRASAAVILGVSAGSSNMARRALDIWDSHMPYEGLDLTEVTIKAHMTQDNQELQQVLLKISTEYDLPICAMEDESAIFITDDAVTCMGRLHWISNGRMQAFAPEMLGR